MSVTRVLLASVCALSATLPTAAAPGDLDTTFNGTGKVTTPIGGADDVGYSMALQSDGKILVAGYSFNGNNYDFTVVRYTGAGALDGDFGTGGKVSTPVGNSDDYGLRIAVQSDGKIVTVGSSYSGTSYEFAVVRHSSDGALDTGFGTGGKVTTPVGSGDAYGYSVAIQSDDKIVVAGHAFNGSNWDFAIVRYTSAGVLDSSFGSGGKVMTPIGPTTDLGYNMTLQSDGKIIVAGYSHNGSTIGFALARYTEAGALDTSFGSGGTVTTVIGSSADIGRSVAVQSDGKIVVAGYSLIGGTNDFAVVRYTSSGVLDSGFGVGGKVTTSIGSGDDYGQSVSVQSDGKILVPGFAWNGSDWNFALVRYTSGGALDASFGSGGKVITSIGSGDDEGRGVAVQSDGRIVVAGNSSNGSDYDFAVVRYEGGPPEIDVTGNGNSISNGAVDTSLANHTDFGSASLTGGSVVRTFAISNAGTAPLGVTGITLGGENSTDFSVGGVTLPLSIVAGGSANFTVTFDPSAPGVRSATVNVANDDGDESDFGFAIQGTGINGAPTDIALSPVTIAEGNAANATVGTLSATDPDAGDTHTFALVSGTGSTDNTSFTISGASLRLTPVADYETKASYALRVRATDAGGLWVERALTVTVTDVSEIPPVFTGYAFSTRSGTAATVALAKILANASDADGGTPAVASVASVSAEGGGIASTATALTYTPPSGFTGTDTFTLTITDGQGASTVGTVTVTVTGGGGSGGGQNQVSFSLAAGQATMVFLGIPGRTYSIQRSMDDLATWSQLTTIQAASDGRILYTDESPPPGSAYYRTQAE